MQALDLYNILLYINICNIQLYKESKLPKTHDQRCHRDSESSAADSGSELTRDEKSAQAFDPGAQASNHYINVDSFRCSDKYLLCRGSPQVSR